MIDIFPDILRGCVTNIMIIILLSTMAEPKYNKKIMHIPILVFFLIDIFANIYFYNIGDYTTLAKFDIVLLCIISIVLKPLFHESIMQWLFNISTVMNVYAAVLVLSYVLCDYFPYPVYANTFLRFILFSGIILLLRYYIRPLYRKVVEHWNIFFLVVVGIEANLLYYIVISSDIETTLINNFVPMILLIILAIFIYMSIIQSFKTISEEYELREENIKIGMQQELLQSELSSYEDFINISKQSRHDLRHHNAILLEYLYKNDVDGAKEYLKLYNDSITETPLYQYCKNPTANAIFRIYEQRTRAAGVTFIINADIPNNLPLTAPEVGVVLSNILENAYEACQKSQSKEKFIGFLAETNEENLRIDLRNTMEGIVKFENELLISTKKDGGIGIKSVMQIVKKSGGMIRFKQLENQFETQIIIPIF